MKREDLKVGNRYIYKNTDIILEILYKGQTKVFVREIYKDGKTLEYPYYYKNILIAIEPLPKEPRKLGRLYMDKTNGVIEVLLKDYEFNSSDEDFIPVTIDKDGNVYEVKND